MKLFEVTVAVTALLTPQNFNGAASFQQHSAGEPTMCYSEDTAEVDLGRSLPAAPHGGGTGVEAAFDRHPCQLLLCPHLPCSKSKEEKCLKQV